MSNGSFRGWNHFRGCNIHFSPQLIADYVTPTQKELCRDLDAKIKPNIRY